MDIKEVENFLKTAGYTQEHDAINMRWPTDYPLAIQQAFYFLYLAGAKPSVVAIGVRDRSVTPLAEVLKAAYRIGED